MIDVLAMAANAVRGAEIQLRAAAAQIVRGGTAAISPVTSTERQTEQSLYRPARVVIPTRVLAEQMASLKKAELDLRADVAAFRTADRMTRRTLDIQA